MNKATVGFHDEGGMTNSRGTEEILFRLLKAVEWVNSEGDDTTKAIDKCGEGRGDLPQ